MLAPGTYLVNRYEIIEKIGSGGMADVYKAKCHMLNRYVAIKVLKADYAADATFVKKFRVEAQSAAGLSHPNIVNVYDVGEDNGLNFIVMELIQGITLKNYIEMKGKLDIREALNIAVQVASGIGAAHENRIIHRDIKPQNIIISRDGKVKVTDFGIAKVADSTTVTTTAAGSVHYISPEQARGGYSDEKSDIYSLGITMYEMLTGRVPFEGETNVAVALLHIQGEMVPPRQLEPGIPRSFEKIILKCTQKKPDLRYASTKDLIADLRKVLTNPNGEYVALASAIPVGGTIVMDDNELSSIKNASAGNGAADVRHMADEEAVTRRSPVKQTPVADEEDDDDEDYDALDDDDKKEVSKPLEKVMMGLTIVGFIVIALIVMFVAGKAIGLFGGSNSSSVVESESDSTEATEEQIEIPSSILGKDREDAKQILNDLNLGFKYAEGPSNTYAEGEAYQTSPAIGEKVDKHTQITVYFSTGSGDFEVSDVSGLTYNQAKTKLESQGLKTAVEYETSDAVAKDKVIRTNPESGSKVSEGSTVTIYVSSGKEEKNATVPNLLGKSKSDAINALENLRLTYYVSDSRSDYSDTYAEGEVMYQSESAGSSVAEGTQVTIGLSLGRKPAESESSSTGSGSYSSTFSPSSPFGIDIKDEAGNYDVYSEGQVAIYIEQGGKTQTVYSKYTTIDSFPASITAYSDTAGIAVAYVTINGITSASWNVTFQ